MNPRLKHLITFAWICQILVITPFLFTKLPEWYPQWTISLGWLLGTITTLLALRRASTLKPENDDKKKSKPMPWLVLLLLLNTIELTGFIWILHELAKSTQNL